MENAFVLKCTCCGFAMLLFLSGEAIAQSETGDGLSNGSPVVEEIVITVHPIFDEKNPRENNILFRFINKLHINTKSNVIEKDLTFKQGDKFDNHVLEESERRLRSRRYFASATVVAENGNSVKNSESGRKVNVDVREVWTFVPKVTYSRTGGNNRYGYGLYDSNFLGLGKTLKVERNSSIERTSDTFEFRDPNFYDEKQLSLLYSNNSDGFAREFHLSNPFRSVKTPWAGGFDFQEFSREDTLFSAGKEAVRFSHDNNYYSLFYGIRLNSSNDERTHRLSYGLDDTSDSFIAVPNTDESIPFKLPFDREYSVAWVEYSYLHSRYVEAKNIQQINRPEDINLGSQMRFRIGRVNSPVAVFDDRASIELEYLKAFQLSDHQIFSMNIASSGFYDFNDIVQSISKVNANYHWSNFSRGQFFISLSEVYGENLFIDTPVELGGDNGLRGYPARFVSGERSHLFTLEQRYFGETEWFSLFHVGAAVFYDQGRVWGESGVAQINEGTLRNVGLGLRISGTRTGGRDEGTHNIAHVDLSYPLDGGSNIDKYQFSVKIKTSF